MDDNKNIEVQEVDELEKSFIETTELVELIFGNDGSYRRWLQENSKWKQQVSAPLYDTQMFACYKKDKQKITANKDKILKEYKKLFSGDDEFIKSIASSTATPTRFLYRTRKLNQIISENI